MVAEELLYLTDTHSLVQHVQSAICVFCNIIDHILAPFDENLVYDIVISDVGMSHYSLVTCSVHERCKSAVVTSATFRNWKRLDMASFMVN